MSGTTLTVRYVRYAVGVGAVAGLGFATDMLTLVTATGTFFGGAAILVTAYYSGRARLRHADADVIRASRCDPKNPAFYPPLHPPSTGGQAQLDAPSDRGGPAGSGRG